MTVIVSGGGSGGGGSGAALTIPSPPPSPKEVPEGPTRSGQIMSPSSAGASATGAISRSGALLLHAADLLRNTLDLPAQDEASDDAAAGEHEHRDAAEDHG